MSAPILLALRILLAISLYAFLSLALYTLWRSLRSGSQERKEPEAPKLTLTLMDDKRQSREFQFDQAQVIIGRDPASDLPIDDKTISSHHTRLFYKQGQWWVDDLQSTNGTLLNGETVEEPIVITDGDELRCGKVWIIISVEGVNSNV